MPNTKFDSKSFNPEAFRYMVGRVPNLTTNEIRKSRALAGDPDIKATFTSQNGTAYARIAMRGLLDGDAVNYDGQTDIPATNTKTFERGVVVVGRAKAWVEKDFSYDITGGVDFMENVAEQVKEYKEGLDQTTLLAILKGIFAMTGAKNLEFVKKHTHDVSSADAGLMTATTLNTACNNACGANKKKFTLVFMHSDVSTNLENLKLMEHLKYTDKDGMTRELDLGTWNGKLVVIDDQMPTQTVAASGSGDTAVPEHTLYTTYVLGHGSISYEDIGAKHPYSMARDEKTNGGQDTLYTRQRKCFAPFGISYEKTKQVTASPTNEELANGTNWTLVHSGEETEKDRSYLNHKAIPIAKIITKG